MIVINTISLIVFVSLMLIVYHNIIFYTIRLDRYLNDLDLKHNYKFIENLQQRFYRIQDDFINAAKDTKLEQWVYRAYITVLCFLVVNFIINL